MDELNENDIMKLNQEMNERYNNPDYELGKDKAKPVQKQKQKKVEYTK